MKTSELTGAALDWAVAKAAGHTIGIVFGRGACRYPGVHARNYAGGTDSMPFVLASTLKEARDADYPGVFFSGTRYWTPSTNWSQGGPIIEREHIGVCYYREADGWEVPNWAAWRTDTDDRVQFMGETALIAAMRCFCSAKLGDEIDIPEELCQQQDS